MPGRDLKPGDRVGPWTLIQDLGPGGNSDVWRATRDGGITEVAVKFISTRRIDSERYRRFVQEVRALRELESLPGVLPLLDANLPPQPTASNPAWLSMPVATPIQKALEGKPLASVVEAIAEIAHTLAALAARGISHRDIKPGNLYWYKGHWVVGDFGLVALPDAEALTRNDKRLGPEHYTPFEMVVDPMNADPKPADVYMLAKTLWVLATDTSFPPGGHQPSTQNELQIANKQSHLHADALDRLVDRATLLRPTSRPAMAAFAADLDAWKDLGGVPGEVDVSDLMRTVREKMRSEIELENTASERLRMARAAAARLTRRCEPLNTAMKKLDARAEVNAFGHDLAGVTHETATMGSGQIIKVDERFGTIRTGPRGYGFAVSYGWTLDLLEDGTLSIGAVVFVGREGVTGSEFWWQARRQAPVGSVEADKDIDELVEEIRPQLLAALKIFADKL